MPPREVTAIATQIASELGWRPKGGGRGGQELSEADMSWAISDALRRYELLGMLADEGDWLTRQWRLTPTGTSTLLATLRTIATGPQSRL
jgi:hypothetical protein